MSIRKIFLLQLFVSICCVLLTACIGEPDVEERVAVGDRLPAFSVTLDDGRVYDSSAPGPSVIVFFHTSCSDCQRELPELDARYKAGEYDGVRIVCISRAEGAESISTFWREHGLTLPYSAQPDRRIYDLFASSVIPRIYTTDARGIVTRIDKPSGE